MNRRKCEKLWMEILESREMLRCIHCGYNRCFAALDYHHIEPTTKEKNICQMTRVPPTPERLKELDKVVCLCVRCHRELHAEKRILKTNILGMPQRQPEQQARGAMNAQRME